MQKYDIISETISTFLWAHIPPGLQVTLPGVDSAPSVIYSAYTHKHTLFYSYAPECFEELFTSHTELQRTLQTILENHLVLLFVEKRSNQSMSDKVKMTAVNSRFAKLKPPSGLPITCFTYTEI